MGAAEPYEKATDGESASILDLGLPYWDEGRRDSRLSQDPDDDTDSLEPSTIGTLVKSIWLRATSDCLLLDVFDGATWEVCGRWRRDNGGLVVW
jgi:hypothetical protein